ncbi:hypothetical protein LG047_15380 [Methylocystis sp. WRRC1]|uniref:hypothetical protein n=1 Tax=Methylocystis sp. WRRC1 TaxID=1732014 RepID=UPI001D152C3F|nr:hypothetical protein [Methylocystis sp. WRRC1]MCC3246682.1 hypothetical protein [Methylocystis sp. WRRC1]
MDGAKAQAKIWRGYGKAALRLGTSFSVYRATNWINPIQALNLRTTILASFTPSSTDQFGYGKSLKPEDYLRNGLFDATDLLPRDILKGDKGTFYIAALEPLLPPTCVRCDRTISLRRQAAQTPQIGEAPYGGVSIAGETALASGVPAAILKASASTRPKGLLPSDAPGPTGFQIFVPLPKGAVRDRDVIADDEGYRYHVSDAQWTLNGYRLEAIRLQA